MVWENSRVIWSDDKSNKLLMRKSLIIKAYEADLNRTIIQHRCIYYLKVFKNNTYQIHSIKQFFFFFPSTSFYLFMSYVSSSLYTITFLYLILTYISPPLLFLVFSLLSSLVSFIFSLLPLHKSLLFCYLDVKMSPYNVI